MAYPQSIALNPQFSILNALISIPQTQISLIQPQISIFISCPSILSQKNGIFDSKNPQNCVISNKMSASATLAALNIFMYKSGIHKIAYFKLFHLFKSGQLEKLSYFHQVQGVLKLWTVFRSKLSLPCSGTWLSWREIKLHIYKESD